jgi:pimeloyl-ACP methyl ester carboxylesterase
MHKQTVQLNKYTAAYTMFGEGTPVIFLHGFFGNASTLELIMEELQDSYCCIALDLLGFGDSSKPKMRYLIDHQVEFLQEFIDVKQIQNFHLVGYSYGGWTAAAYAIAKSKEAKVNERNNTTSNVITQQISSLKSMVLLAPAGIRDDSFVGRYNHLRPLLWDTKLVDFGLDILSPFANLIGKGKQFTTIRVARNAIVSQPAGKSLLCDRLRPEDAVDTVEKEIHEIITPTLVIAGEKDSQIPLWHCQTYAETIPQCNFEIIPGADHDLVHTDNIEVANRIRKYWQSLLEA